MLWPYAMFGANQKPNLRLWRSQAGLDHVKYKALHRIVWNCESYIFTHLGIRKFTEIHAQGFKCTQSAQTKL